MTAKKKLAQKRLALLQVAEKLRNVSEACRRHGVSRSQFYEYKRFGFKNFPQLIHEGVPQEVFLALPFNEVIPNGRVFFHKGFWAKE